MHRLVARGGLARGCASPRRNSGPAHAQVSLRPRAQSLKPSGVSNHRKGFGRQLKDAKEIVECLGAIGPEYGYKPARTGPRLTCYAIPEDFGGGGASLGLSSLRNSHQEAEKADQSTNSAGAALVRLSLIHI